MFFNSHFSQPSSKKVTKTILLEYLNYSWKKFEKKSIKNNQDLIDSNPFMEIPFLNKVFP
jgi:hypothetical protein